MVIETNTARISRILRVKKAYEKYKTLKETAENLNMSKERVRQILKMGEKLGLFTYKTNSKKRKEELDQQIKASHIENLINKGYTRFEISKRLKITPGELDYLRKHLKIKPNINNASAKQERYLRQYLKLSKKIGRYPTVTELKANKNTRSLYNQIQKYWGGIKNLRKSNNIPKPNLNIPKKARKKQIDLLRKQG